jgi:hypothetical protein
VLTLGHFERLAKPPSSRAVTQNALDQFILDRGQEVQKNTLNKDIGCGNDMSPSSLFSGLIDDACIYTRAVKP